MTSLQWVSEWRIDKNSDSELYPFKITNGGVYTIAKDMDEALKIRDNNIREERTRYHIESLLCPNCNKRFAEHDGMITYRNCLLKLAMDGIRR